MPAKNSAMVFSGGEPFIYDEVSLHFFANTQLRFSTPLFLLSLLDFLENNFAMQNKTVLAFLDDVYEDLELWYPKLRLEEAGYALK